MSNLFLIISFLLFTSITYGEKSQEVVIKKTDRIVKVPKSFWNLVKTNLVAEGVADKDFLKSEMERLPLEVNLVEKTKGALRNKNYIYKIVDGEGNIDFSNLVLNRKGDFTFSLKPKDHEGKDLDKYHLYFISYSKERNEFNQKWGNGCGKILDLTDSRSQIEEGLLLTASKQHYLSLLGGMFVVVKYDNKKIYLSQIELTDMRYPHLYCDFVRQI